MVLVLNKPVLQPLNDPPFEKKKLNVFVLRDDLIHPFISGNKWRKLKYNIEAFQREGKEYLVTFGGAFSNHIVATASAGKELGIKTIGIIRGEELTNKTNPALRFADECGMKLIFVSREEYKSIRSSDSSGEMIERISPLLWREVRSEATFILPEGGANSLAMKGCEEIIEDIHVDFDYICCACGTGTTFSGIINGIKNEQQAIGVVVLKNGEFIFDDVKKQVDNKNNFHLMHNYHFGGYAKSTGELEDFCGSFIERTNIPIEPVYTGKLFFGIYDLIQKDFFHPEKTIVIVHTGGVAFNSRQ